MLRVRSASNYASALRLFSSTTATKSLDTSEELKIVKLALVRSVVDYHLCNSDPQGAEHKLLQEDALEGVNYIRQSAHQVVCAAFCVLFYTRA